MSLIRSVAPAVVLLVGCTSLPETAADASREGRQCFLGSQVNGFNAVDDRTVDVTVGVSDVYRLQLMAPCPDVNWREAIAIRSRGSDWICRGIDAELLVPTSIGPQRCPVTAIRKLTDDEVKASRARKSGS